MKFEPHVYQQHMVDWITQRPEAGLLLDMGMGKTAITLAAIDRLMFDTFDIARVLVVAPLKVAENTWTDEREKWDDFRHLRMARILGTAEQRLAALRQDADVYIINRENFQWLMEQHGTYTDKVRRTGWRWQKPWPYDMIVIDELSAFRTYGCRRFRMMRWARTKTDRMLGLTGTPAPNGLMNLWAQAFVLDGGERLGKTLGGFQEQYFDPCDYIRGPHGLIPTKYKPKPEAEDAIYKAVADLFVAMKAEDWLDMPERIDNVIRVDIPDRAAYERLEKQRVLEMTDGGIIKAGSAGALAGKLLQMANGAVYDRDGVVQHIHDAKLEALADMIDDADGKPMMICYWFKHDLTRIEAYLKAKKIKTVRMEGPDVVKAWNDHKIQVLLVHPARAGHGLNLQRGGNLITWFGLTHDLELYQQANGRLFRQGQTESTVIINHITAAGTVDEEILPALMDKDATQDKLMQAVKARVEKYER